MDRKINISKLGRTQVSNFDYSDETSNFPKVIKKTLSIDIALSIFPQKSLKTTYYYSILKIRMFPKTSFFLTNFLLKSLWEFKLFENSHQASSGCKWIKNQLNFLRIVSLMPYSIVWINVCQKKRWSSLTFLS